MDQELVSFGVRAFVTLLAVVDPLGNVPFFLTATEAMAPDHRRRVALRASVICALVLLAFAVGGTAVLWAFHITMPAVRIGGGIILLVIALQMLSGYQFAWERVHPAVVPGLAPAEPGVVPLAIPLMAGPGAMSSVIVLAAQGPGLPHLLLVALAIVLVSAISWAAYLLALPIVNRLGKASMVALSSLMGLILAALAVQFMLDGLREAVPSLFAPR